MTTFTMDYINNKMENGGELTQAEMNWISEAIKQPVTYEEVVQEDNRTPIHVFEAGKTYITYTTTGLERLFVCTGVSSDRIKGIFNGGKEKSFRMELGWETMQEQNEGKKPFTQTAKVDTRFNLNVSADHFKK